MNPEVEDVLVGILALYGLILAILWGNNSYYIR